MAKLAVCNSLATDSVPPGLDCGSVNPTTLMWNSIMLWCNASNAAVCEDQYTFSNVSGIWNCKGKRERVPATTKLTRSLYFFCKGIEMKLDLDTQIPSSLPRYRGIVSL